MYVAGKSETARGGPEKALLSIEQTASRMRHRFVVTNRGREERGEFEYPVEGESRNSMRGLSIHSRTSWEGGSLIVNGRATLPGDGGEMVVREKFTLGSGGKNLTLERHQTFGGRENKETLFFERASPEAIAEFNRPEKKAGEQYKNLRVLGEIPSSELLPTMIRFQAALGVKCDHCHVPNQWEREKRAAKQVARKMIEMVHSINRVHFDGRAAVSCETCHRGQPKPSTGQAAAKQ